MRKSTKPTKDTPVEAIPPKNLNDVKDFKFGELLALLNEIDNPTASKLVIEEPTEAIFTHFKEALNHFIEEPEEARTKRAVLGIDIYKYSKLDYNKQKLIPFIFSLLREHTKRLFIDFESIFSSRYEKDQIENELIHTGDGGYLFFYTPLEAVVFLLMFNGYLHLFNSYHVYPSLRKYLGPLTLRYAITYDYAYKIDSMFYGPAITNNARIISTDKLDRFLIDQKSYEWFLLNTNGIENLAYLNSNHLEYLYDPINIKNNSLTSNLFNPQNKALIRNVNCQKLGQIIIKEESFDVYNIMIQSLANFHANGDDVCFISTVGNMNCNGI